MKYAFILLLFVFACTQPVLEGDLIISDVNIVDVKTGAIRGHMDIAISNDTIRSITEHGKNTLRSGRTINASGQYAIPGLWDMHVHTWFAFKDHAPLLLANGVTGVRDMFGAPSEVNKIRTQQRNGSVTGPTIVSSGAIIDGKNYRWPGSDAANTPEDARMFVREQIKQGADFIKVYSGLNPDAFMAVAAECKKVNFPFCGHIPTRVRLEDAVNAGMLSAEHFFGVLEFTSSARDSMYARIRADENDPLLTRFRHRLKFVTDTFDKNRVSQLAAVLRGGNMYLTPTSVVNRAFAFMNDTSFVNDKRKAYMPDYLMSDWNPSLTPEDTDIERKWYNLTLSIMKEMVDGGVQFLAGTDYGNPYVFPGFSLHDELGIFVRDAHFTPLQALQTATINPAYYLRRQGTQGTVDENKVADLVLLSANPLDDITNTKKIEGVVLRGKYHDGDTLRSNLEEIASRNK